MQGEVLQVSVSRGGIPKLGIAEAFVGRLGIEGDRHAHPLIHGGPRQAVLLICSEAIGELTALGYPVFPGALGENITTRGVDRRQMRAGQRYRIGQAFVELTKIRTPCKALDVFGPDLKREIYDARVRDGDAGSPLWARSGFYASVVVPGLVRKGDIIVLTDQVV